jgi:hypothetical protein
MRVRVNFKVNTETGEVEEFLIVDISTEAEPEHDAVHDRIAVEVGQVVDRRPAPQQVTGPADGDASSLVYQSADELPPYSEQEEARE